MSEQKHYSEDEYRRPMYYESRYNNSHLWTGLFLLLVGAVALAKSMGVPVPRWLFTWQMLLITIGVFVGIKKGFRDSGWFVPIIIGGAFLANDYLLRGEMRKHIWPVAIIAVGLLFLIRARARHSFSGTTAPKGYPPPKPSNIVEDIFEDELEYSDDDVLRVTHIFGGGKKVILSKNFKGGEIVNIFGGCEIDLTQADMKAVAALDVTAIFGGATLIIPSHWVIRSEAVTIFGGINDKRKIMPGNEKTLRTLVIKGTLLFGGLEIKSY